MRLSVPDRDRWEIAYSCPLKGTASIGPGKEELTLLGRWHELVQRNNPYGFRKFLRPNRADSEHVERSFPSIKIHRAVPMLLTRRIREEFFAHDHARDSTVSVRESR